MRDDMPPHDQEDENFPEFLTYPQAAALLQVSQRTLWTWTQQGRVPHFRIGKTVRFSRAALLRWIEQQLRGGTDEHGADGGADDGDDRAEGDDEVGGDADRDEKAA